MQPAQDKLSLVAGLIRDSRLTGSDLAAVPPPVPSALAGRYRPVGPAVPLPPPAAGEVSLECVLQSRTAIREYSPAHVSQEHLATVLEGAMQSDHRMWPEECAAGASLHLLLLAWRVNGLPAALYHFDDQRSLSPLAALPPPEESVEMMIQQEFCNAPVIVLVHGNLVGAVARYGSHGYRQLLCRAGAAAHAGWLAALHLGLVGTVFAGVIPHVLRGLADINGYTTAPLFALSVGRPRR